MSHNLLSKTGLTYFWGKLKAYFAKGNGRVFYGTCSTGGSTAAKVVVCPDFTAADLTAGTILIVSFSSANTAAVSNLTLNVNNTGACPIKKIDGTAYGDLTAAGEIRGTANMFIVTGTTSPAFILVSSDYDTTYSTITDSEISTGTDRGKRAVSPKVLRDNFYTESEVDALIAGIGGTPVATTQPSGGMLPNVLYKLGTLSGSVTLSLAAATDNTIENEYHFTFDTSSTAPTITWPSNLTWAGGSAPTINASKHYEVSIEDGYAYATEF